MHLGYHGGKCCGIKHIRGLSASGPSGDIYSTAAELSHVGENGVPYDGSTNVQSDTRFFRAKAPQETPGERFDRYLEYLKEKRPGGIVEVVTSEGASYGKQHELWMPFLLERGFRHVTRCYNSNSGYYINVFHLAMMPENKKVEQPTNA